MLDAEIRFRVDLPKALSISKAVRHTVLKDVAQEVERQEKRIMKGPRHGLLYKRRKRPGKGEFHRASAPQEPPAIDYGRLEASIGHWIDPDATEALVGTTDKYGTGVGSPVQYGKFLEFGTSRMAPRPWLTPVMAKLRAIVANTMRKFRRPA